MLRHVIERVASLVDARGDSRKEFGLAVFGNSGEFRGSRLLNNHLDPTLTELEMVCNYLEISMGELFEGPEPVPHPEIVANLKRLLRATDDPGVVRRIKRLIDGELLDLKEIKTKPPPVASGE